MTNEKKKETQKNMILPEAIEAVSDYVILSLEYELRMLEVIREKETGK